MQNRPEDPRYCGPVDIVSISPSPPDRVSIELTDGTVCDVPAATVFRVDLHGALQRAVTKETGRLLLLPMLTPVSWRVRVRRMLQEGGPQDE